MSKKKVKVVEAPVEEKVEEVAAEVEAVVEKPETIKPTPAIAKKIGGKEIISAQLSTEGYYVIKDVERTTYKMSKEEYAKLK